MHVMRYRLLMHAAYPVRWAPRAHAVTRASFLRWPRCLAPKRQARPDTFLAFAGTASDTSPHVSTSRARTRVGTECPPYEKRLDMLLVNVYCIK